MKKLLLALVLIIAVAAPSYGATLAAQGAAATIARHVAAPSYGAKYRCTNVPSKNSQKIIERKRPLAVSILTGERRRLL